MSGLTERAPPSLVVAFDEEQNHAGGGRNVAFVDGHVAWRTEDDFQRELKRTLDWLARRPRPGP